MPELGERAWQWRRQYGDAAATSEQSEHVVYRGSDSKIHELYNALLSNKGWQYNAMTNQIDNLPDAIGDPYGYTGEAQGSEHIVFQKMLARRMNFIIPREWRCGRRRWSHDSDSAEG